jgi:hypothetical protein
MHKWAQHLQEQLEAELQQVKEEELQQDNDLSSTPTPTNVTNRTSN